MALGGLAHEAAWAEHELQALVCSPGLPTPETLGFVLAPPWWECSTSFAPIEARDTACACKLT